MVTIARSQGNLKKFENLMQVKYYLLHALFAFAFQEDKIDSKITDLWLYGVRAGGRKVERPVSCKAASACNRHDPKPRFTLT